MSNNVKNMLDNKVIEFNARINDEPDFAKLIEGKNRTICICVSDGENYSSKLENLVLDDFVVTDNTSKDLVINASSEILEALITKIMSPIKAYMKGDLKVKASFTDMLLLKRLF